MAVTLAVSYLAQKKDANMEKYKSCGQGKLCLHIPKWFLLQREFFSDKGSTQSYGDGTDVKKSFNDLVSLSGFSGGETLRMNLMSPCKADIQVKADDKACKCEYFYDKDKIWFKLQKNKCALAEDEYENSVVYTLPDGSCPATVKGTKFGARNEEEKIFEIKTVPEYSNARYSCPITNKDNLLEDLEFCGRNKIYDKACLTSKGKIASTISDADYRNWLLSASTDELNVCTYDSLRECSCTSKDPNVCKYPVLKSVDGNGVGEWKNIPGGIICDGVTKLPSDINNGPYYVNLVQYDQKKYSGSDKAYLNRDAVAVPLNILPSVDKTKPAETIAVCENSWVGDVLEIIKDRPSNQKKCITVTPDPNSMKTYSEAGFGTNFCAENKASFAAKVEDACFWGTIAVSIGAEMVSMGAATPAVLYAVGSGGAACEKITQMSQKWPKDQF